jgi:cbb3-type cytochrome oxidase maturation protein
MADFLYLVPIALGLGAIGLLAFMWSLRSGQYEDMNGAAERILFEETDKPLAKPTASEKPPKGPSR